jgi:DNA-directed RNA polymerase specialized sigma24 family protein
MSISNSPIPSPESEAHLLLSGTIAANADQIRPTEQIQVHQLNTQGQTPAEISVDLSLPAATVNSDLFIGIPKMPGHLGTTISLNA